MEIAVVGAGHAGLVAAAGLASIEHRVRVLDSDAGRVDSLRHGLVPFLEPGLDELVGEGTAAGSLSFHRDAATALPPAEVIFICVGTPNDASGQVDLSAVVEATTAVAAHGREGATLVNRSTAPVGTAAYLRDVLEEHQSGSIHVAVNPEFLAEGTGVRDFLSPDRIVVGAWDARPIERLRAIYEPIIRRAPRPEERRGGSVPLLVTDPPTAELTKYAANAFLAVKISFINEIASIAEELGADVAEISRAIGLDHRIGPDFLKAGVGWGGSCFPKDIMALQGTAEMRGVATRMLRAANDVNTEQHRWVIRKLQAHLKALVGRRVGLLGLSFKPHTDDVRHAPSLEVASTLAKFGVRTTAFDPSVHSVPEELAGLVQLAPDPYALASGADALVLITDWPEFAELDLHRLARTMRTPLLLDGRNALDPASVRDAGLTYVGVGRATLLATPAGHEERDSVGTPAPVGG